MPQRRALAKQRRVVELERRVTWGEIDKRTDALDHALRGFGVNVDDRVAVLAHDCIEVAETFLVASKIGAIRVDLNARLATAEILALIREGQWVLDGQRRYTNSGDD